MSSVQLISRVSIVPQPSLEQAEPHWYAIQVRCQFEKKAAQQLQERGIDAFLPILKQRRRWSDRWQTLEIPTFPGYAFVHLEATPARRIQVLQTRGVMSFVAFGGKLVPICDKQIDDIRLLTSQDVPHYAHSFIKVGQRVRIRGGCLDGIEGVLTSNTGHKMLVISIGPIQQSIAISVADYDIELA